jgi:hypothetical protein
MGIRVRAGGAWGVALAALAACSGRTVVQVEKADGAGGTTTVSYGGATSVGASGGASGGSGAEGRGGAAGSGGVSGSAGTASGGSDGAGNDGGACVSISFEAKVAPLDLFILLDKSGSMALSVDRWTPVTSAIRAFVEAPGNAGVGVGLGYFGFHPNGPPANPTEPGSCSPNDYATPDVAIDVVPNVRQPIIDSLGRNQPGGARPTQPALQGALQYATQWAVTHPDRAVSVVLATDGEPQGCTGDIGTVSQLAAAGAAYNPRITTYVVAIGDVDGLNQIAQAGGTGQAFIVQDSNAGQQFLNALNQIRGPGLGCEFTLPRTTLPVDYQKVNVIHAPPGGGQRIIYFVDGPGDCRPDTGGWYYLLDVLRNPTAIRLCPVSCTEVSNAGGRLDIAFGCFSVPPSP